MKYDTKCFSDEMHYPVAWPLIQAGRSNLFCSIPRLPDEGCIETVGLIIPALPLIQPVVSSPGGLSCWHAMIKKS
jgi:hypothetical protein